jgi:hypothetical protein
MLGIPKRNLKDIRREIFTSGLSEALTSPVDGMAASISSSFDVDVFRPSRRILVVYNLGRIMTMDLRFLLNWLPLHVEHFVLIFVPLEGRHVGGDSRLPHLLKQSLSVRERMDRASSTY